MYHFFICLTTCLFNPTLKIIMSIIDKIYNNVFADFNVYHLLRLVIIIGGYAILRQRATEWLKQRQLKSQLEHDERLKAESLIQKPGEAEEADDYDDTIKQSEKAWGWGKATRRKVKKQQEIFEKEIEKAAVEAQKKLNSSYDSDDEINELLED